MTLGESQPFDSLSFGFHSPMPTPVLNQHKMKQRKERGRRKGKEEMRKERQC